jgi:hypothetical protein
MIRLKPGSRMPSPVLGVDNANLAAAVLDELAVKAA